MHDISGRTESCQKIESKILCRCIEPKRQGRKGGSSKEILASNGRVAILTFHSGEDRLVKRSFKQLKKQGIYSEINEDVIRPSAEECARNPRAKSIKMRWTVMSS